MRKKGYAILLLMTVSLLCTGCGRQLPDLTQEQAEVVGDYAAGLLLKYDANSRSRLVDISLLSQAEEESTQEPAQDSGDEEQTGMRPTADTPVVAVGEETKEKSVPLEQILELPEGVTLSYQDMRIADSYPDIADGEVGFGVDAAQGKMLLILEFNLDNASSEDQEIDLFTSSPVFVITVNGNIRRNALITLLTDDLSAYTGKIPAGGRAETVLLMDIDEMKLEDITEVSLTVKNGSQTETILLK